MKNARLIYMGCDFDLECCECGHVGSISGFEYGEKLIQCSECGAVYYPQVVLEYLPDVTERERRKETKERSVNK
jgi:recombinational DNA repair protein (RecF pathway)